MDKNSFLELGKKVEGFGVINPDRAPKGLTAILLWDLWDMGVKFGQFIPKGLGFRSSGLYLELYKFDYKKGGHNGFMVGKTRESGVTEDGVYMFELQNRMTVIWDKGFSVADVQAIIKLIDLLSTATGEKIGNSRIILLEQETKPKKIGVAQMFKDTRTVMPVMPDLDINSVLGDFDHPELLGVIPIGPIKLLCLESEKEALAADQERKARILGEMGLNLRDIENMPADDIVGLKRLISQRSN